MPQSVEVGLRPREPSIRVPAPPDQAEIPPCSLPVPPVAPERSLVAPRAAGQDDYVAHARLNELPAGGAGQIEMRLPRRPGDRDLLAAGADDLVGDLLPDPLAAASRRR